MPESDPLALGDGGEEERGQGHQVHYCLQGEDVLEELRGGQGPQTAEHQEQQAQGVVNLQTAGLNRKLN